MLFKKSHLTLCLNRIFFMAHKKPNLPTKDCVVCEKPFAWRKKWERVWDDVKYCSERCRRNAKGKSS
jgi:hypothetical protein